MWEPGQRMQWTPGKGAFSNYGDKKRGGGGQNWVKFGPRSC